MESTNNDDLHLQHHNKLQDHHLARSSSIIIPSSLAFPSLSDVEGNSDEHAWRSSSTFFLNNNIHANSIEAPPNTFNNSMIQDLRYSLPSSINNIIQSTSYNEHHQHLISNKIKEESSTSSDQSNSSSFQTFGELLSPSTNTPSEMLLLNTLSPTYKNHMFHPSTFQPNMQFQDNNTSNNNSDLPGIITSFSQIFPSVNISKLSSSAMDSSNFRGNLDLLASQQRSFFGGRSLNQAPNSNLLELFKDSSQYGSVDHDLQQSNDLRLCNASTHLSSFNNNGILEAKRSSCIVEPNNSSHQSVSKKQRFETRASCPPFKVRKEKLGDRIAALQQLVAPFGKTDTASVLSEAIGYIKFLQNQIETLSVPYMKLGSRNRSSNNLHRISDESEANKQDLRSRGLCLVPLTCMSYIASDCEITGPSAWPPSHNFNPGF